MKRILLIFSILMVMVFFTSCKEKDDYKLSIVSPSGAPAIAIADLAYNYSEEYEFNINKTPEVLSASFIANEADVIIAPINMGATMYNKTGNYVLASMVTWGNLYFASRMTGFSLDSMTGKNLVFFGQNTINQYIVESVLAYNNVAYASIDYLSDTNLTKNELLGNESAIVLIAEPALSVAKTKYPEIEAISVQELYSEMTGSGSYPQAGCFIRKSTIEEHKSVVNTFISKLEKSVKKVNDDTKTIASYAEELAMGGTAVVLENAIPNCNIAYKSAIDSKSQIEVLFANALSYCGGALPNEEFYYSK